MKKLHAKFKYREYDFLYGSGLINKTAILLTGLKVDKNVLIVSEKIIKKLHGAKLETSLKKSGYKYSWHLVKGGDNKTLAEISKIYSACDKQKITRNSVIIAFGGGLVQDLACYSSATYKRGINFVQIPTTLLIQADVNIGGCAVDLPEGKSMIGTFYQPILVIQDTDLVKSLPESIYIDGIAEIVKYAITNNFIDQLEKDFPKLLNRTPKIIEKYNYLSNKIKTDLTQQDETDSADIRIKIDLGHTFSHAIEAEMEYKISHGKALSIGLCAASMLSAKKLNFPMKKVEQITNLLAKAGLPVSLPQGLRLESLLSHIKKDKKYRNNKSVFILIKNLGKLEISDKISEQDVKNPLKQITQ